MLTDLQAQLSQITHNKGPGYVQRFEDVLGHIMNLKDPHSIALLLPFFDDEAEYDEMMFSIIHAIESFDDKLYVSEILSHLAPFYRKAPRWAAIVQMRILNSPSALAAYQTVIKTISEDQKGALRDLLSAICKKHRKFESICKELTVAL